MAAIRSPARPPGASPGQDAGSYHGHADIAAREVPFNDAAALELGIEETQPAAVLMEGAMTSGGLACPSPATWRPCESSPGATESS